MKKENEGKYEVGALPGKGSGSRVMGNCFGGGASAAGASQACGGHRHLHLHPHRQDVNGALRVGGGTQPLQRLLVGQQRAERLQHALVVGPGPACVLL